MAVALRLRGRIDADALGAALTDVVDRHESLRTLFAAPDGIPQQVVVPVERAEFGWDVIDASGWSASRLDDAVGAAARHTFDLASHIPFHATFSGSPTPNTYWLPWCTTSPPTAGRSPRWCAIWGWRTPAGAWAKPPIGRRCRCSTSTSRCGSASNSVISKTAAARSPSSWTTGNTPWPGCPNGCSCRPIGPTRRSRTTAAHG